MSYRNCNEWPNQFVLSRRAEYIPKGWHVRQINSWKLGVHAQLPVVQIVASGDEPIGWILGWPIVIDAERILDENDKYRIYTEEDRIFELGGRWLAIFADRNKVYPDATGSIASVYSRRKQIVASTTGLLPDADFDDLHHNLVGKLGIPFENRWYPFGITAHAEARRTLPNHCLDIAEFSQTRIWPDANIRRESAASTAVEKIIKIGRAQLNAIAKDYRLKGNLTAGRDTRMILALARRHVNNIQFYTRSSSTYGDRLDCSTSAAIASACNLHLNIIDEKTATEEQLEAWQQRVGRCVAGAVWKSVETWRQSNVDRANIPGMVGGIGRAFYTTTKNIDELRGTDLCSILKMPQHELLIESANDWLAKVLEHGELTVRQLLDLTYLEQRVGCWGAPTFYGNTDSAPAFWIVSHREIIDNIVRLPENYKIDKRLQPDVIANTWPALLKYPFNRPYGYRNISLHAFRVRRRLSSAFARFVDRVSDS